MQVFNPSGDLIGGIRLPGAVNFTFAGRPQGMVPGVDNNILYITADTAIWAATLQAAGTISQEVANSKQQVARW